MYTYGLLFSDDLIESVQATLPELLLDLFVLVTLFGDEETYVVILLLFFYAVDREKGIALIAVALTVAAITPGLKETIGLPRPPEELWYRVDADHNGVPSGHTLGAVAIYGALLYATDRFSNAQLAGVTVAIGVLMGTSRIVLGVHYPADVLAGFAIGVLFLGLFVGYARLEVRETFLIAFALTIPIFALHWDLTSIYFGAGGLVGAAIGWAVRTDAGTIDVSRPIGAVAVVGGVVVVLLVTIVLEQLPVHALPVAVVVGAVAVMYPDLYHRTSFQLRRLRRSDDGPRG